ncbi:MAG: DNA alkylation repair protein [Flavobacteriales bacterium]
MAKKASKSISAIQGRARNDKSRATKADVLAVLDALKKASSPKVRNDMSARYGIITPKAFGVMMRDMQAIAKSIGRDHDFAQLLWETGWYEARMVACMIDEPEKVTPTRMEAWCKDFDNWAITDTVCFKLWDQVPHALKKVDQWAKRKEEFQKRAAFALLACLALHRNEAPEKYLLDRIALAENAASDERNFVKKSVSWALRSMAGKSTTLRDAVIASTEKLAASTNATERWVGKDVLRDIKRPLVAKRAAKRDEKSDGKGRAFRAPTKKQRT